MFGTKPWEAMKKAYHSTWSNIARELDIDLSALHRETSLLPKLNQEVNAWSLSNGEAFC